MNSAAYQRSSKPLPGNEADDRFYSHYLIRRLPAEVILDAYSQVTACRRRSRRWSRRPATRPRPTTAIRWARGRCSCRIRWWRRGSWRRSAGRSAWQTCSCERQQDSSVGQALHVNNGQTLNDKLRDPRARVEAWLKEKVGDEEAVRRLYLLALSREPTPAEARKFHDLLAEAAADGKTTRREALEDLFWAVLASKEFLFNH